MMLSSMVEWMIYLICTLLHNLRIANSPKICLRMKESCYQLFAIELGGGGYLDLFSYGDVPFCPKNWYP